MEPVFTSTIESAQWSVSAVFGKGGSGKTDLVRKLIEAGLQVAVIDCDNGLKTLQDVMGNGNLLLTKAGTIGEFKGALAAAKTLPAETVVFLDGLSRLLDRKSEELQGDSTKLTLDQHGQVGDYAKRLFLYLNRRQLEHNVIVTCLEEGLQDEQGRFYWGPLFPGKMPLRNFPDKFDLIARTGVSTGQNGETFEVTVKATETTLTKLRCPASIYEKIPTTIPAESFGRFYKTIVLNREDS